MFVEASVDGTLNGAISVDVVPAPPAATRRLIKTINISNNDTADVICTIVLKNGANSRVIWSGTLNPGDTWQYGDAGDVTVLDTMSKSISASLAAPPATTNPDFVATYGDAS